jgi:hypothetical protein
MSSLCDSHHLRELLQLRLHALSLDSRFRSRGILIPPQLPPDARPAFRLRGPARTLPVRLALQTSRPCHQSCPIHSLALRCVRRSRLN